MKIRKVSPLLFFIIIFVFLGMTSQIGFAQGLFGPWGFPWIGSPFSSPFAPFGGAYLPSVNLFNPLYGRNVGWGYPFSPITTPTPTLLSPYQRSPNATIIFTSPTLTAVTSAPGVILIGATGVLAAPTAAVLAAPTAAVIPAPTAAVLPAPTVVTPTAVAASLPTEVALPNPTPAPLFSLLAVLYASGTLDGKALLSTANPLLFAYLQTLIF